MDRSRWTSRRTSFTARSLTLRTSSFQGRSPAELEAAFRDSIDDYLDYCSELGQEPNRPFSGQFLVRAEPELHRSLFVAATVERTSVNQFVVERLSEIMAIWNREREGQTSAGVGIECTNLDLWPIDKGQYDIFLKSNLLAFSVNEPEEKFEPSAFREVSLIAVVGPHGLSGFGIEQGQ